MALRRMGLEEDTEEPIDWLETQLELMKQVGEAHDLAQQLKKES